MSTLPSEINRIGYDMLNRRVHAAEAVARNALAMTPYTGETAAEFAKRIRFYAERTHPELIIRFEHSRQDIYRRAENCGCNPTSDGYDDDHCCESDQGGEYLCGRQYLGTVCGDCETEDGPAWRPDRYEWPCPTVRALDTTA
jgi:hypothetical protein